MSSRRRHTLAAAVETAKYWFLLAGTALILVGLVVAAVLILGHLDTGHAPHVTPRPTGATP